MAIGLILAAGAGRRFGSTKQLAELDGRPLLEHGLDGMLAAEGIERVIVVLGHDAERIRAQVDFRTAEVVVAEDWADGQSVSLRRGIEAARDAEVVVVTLGDQPFMSEELISGALAQLDGYDAVRALYGGLPGHPVVLGRRVLDAAAGLGGDRDHGVRGDLGARELLSRFNVNRWDASELGDAFDVDTRADLESLG